MMNISSNISTSVSATSSQVMNAVTGSVKRSQFAITNTSVAAVVTIAKGTFTATAGAGLVLQPKQTYIESTDSGFTCWQGAVQAVSDVAGTIAIVETIEAD